MARHISAFDSPPQIAREKAASPTGNVSSRSFNPLPRKREGERPVAAFFVIVSFEFQSAPPQTRGRKCRCGETPAGPSRFNPLPRNREGERRRHCRTACKVTLFQSAPPQTRGRKTSESRIVSVRPRRFNPLPRKREGESDAVWSPQVAATVSIRSPANAREKAGHGRAPVRPPAGFNPLPRKREGERRQAGETARSALQFQSAPPQTRGRKVL